jgi:hypothetical protein
MQPIQQHSPTFFGSRTVGASSDASSLYVDPRKMNKSNGSNSISDLELILMRRNPTKDDLPPDLQMTD